MTRYLTLVGLLAFLGTAPSFADQRKDWCGILGNTSVVIPNVFLFYPPERDGDSWSSDRISSIPTECDKKLKSIVLEFYYPNMEAAGLRNPYDDPDQRHVQLALSALPAGYSTSMLTRRIGRYVPEYEQHESNNKKYGLFVNRSLDPVYRKNALEALWQADKNSGIKIIIICRQVNKGFSSVCKLNYVRDDIPVEVNVRFSYNMLSEWSAIMGKANFLIDSLQK